MSADNSQHPMQWSVLESHHATDAHLRSGTWDDLCNLMNDAPVYAQKDQQPLIKLGVFQNNSRAAGNELETITGIEIDYDAGLVPIEQAAQKIRTAGVEALLCSTFTATPDCHKWRIFIPLSKTTHAVHRKAWVAAADRVLGNIAAPESMTPKQIFYYGRNSINYQVIHCQGELLDTIPAMIDVADEYATGADNNPAHKTEYHSGGTSDVSEAQVREVLSKIPPDIDRVLWVKILAGVYSTGHYEAALWWSRLSEKHDEEKFQKEWGSFSTGVRTGFGTVIYYARQYSGTVDNKRRATCHHRTSYRRGLSAGAYSSRW